MRHLRIYDQDHTEELLNVARCSVTPAGALAVELEHGEQPGTLRGVILAPGTWTRAEDWNGLRDQDQQPAEQLADPGPALLSPELERELAEPEQLGPVDAPTDPRPIERPAALLPGGVQLPGESVGIVRDPLALSDGLRLRHAMEVHCICAALRCPELVYYGLPGGGTEPRQCDQRDMHDGQHDFMGRWWWGPHNHHAECPRNPRHYNAHVGDRCGRLVEIEGLPLVGTGCLLPWDHTGAHDYATPGAEGQPQAAAGLTGPGLATIPTQRARHSAAAALAAVGLIGAAETLTTAWPAVAAGEQPPAPEPAAEPAADVLSGLVLPRPLTDPALREHDSRPPTPAGWFHDRTVGEQCRALSMDGEPCERPAEHTDGPHAHFTPDGGLIQW